jgi:hypothetical protein
MDIDLIKAYTGLQLYLENSARNGIAIMILAVMILAETTSILSRDDIPEGDSMIEHGITYELIFVFHSFTRFLSLHPLLTQSISVSGLSHSPTCDESFILTMCFVHYEFGSSRISIQVPDFFLHLIFRKFTSDISDCFPSV